MIFFKSKQEKIDFLMTKLAGKTKRLLYMSKLTDFNGNVPWSEIADLHEEIAILSEKIRILSRS